MKTITIIRHAESYFNVGQYKNPEDVRNCRITPNGITQAQNLSGEYDVVICSPLKRAIETYVNSHIKCRKFMVSDLVREIQDAKPLNSIELEPLMFEKEYDIVKRAKETVDFVHEFQSSDTICIISHACFMYYILRAFGQDLSQFNKGIYNCQQITFVI